MAFVNYYSSGVLSQSKVFEQDGLFLTICTCVLVLMLLSTLKDRLTPAGLLMDLATAVVIITTTQSRMELARLGTKDDSSHKAFLEFCLDSWLASIILESRSIYYIVKLNSYLKRCVFDPRSYLFGYYITANAGVLMLQYCTYIHTFVGEAIVNQEHVMVLFILTAGVEMCRILTQGPLLCRALSPANFQFNDHNGHPQSLLLRLIFSNVVMGFNSYMLFEGLTSFGRTGFMLFEPSWTSLHHAMMFGDFVLRIICAFIFFWCFLSNLSLQHRSVSLQQIVLHFLRRCLWQIHRNNIHNQNLDVHDTNKNGDLIVLEAPIGLELHQSAKPEVNEVIQFCDFNGQERFCFVAFLEAEDYMYYSGAPFSYLTVPNVDHNNFYPGHMALPPSLTVCSAIFQRHDTLPHPTLVCCPFLLPHCSQSVTSPLVICANIRLVCITGRDVIVCDMFNRYSVFSTSSEIVHGRIH